MGEHGSWFDFLYHIDGFRDLHSSVAEPLDRDWKFLIFQETHFELTHLFWALVVLGFIVYGGVKFHRSVSAKDGVIPSRKFGIRSFLEMFSDATYSTAVQVMGAKPAKKHLPFIGGMAIFILLSNLLALVPGGAIPTSTLKTNLLMATVVFLVYNYYGIREHGLAYFKHFLGPVALLAPLMLFIELIGHFARILSLSIRLLGNMAADHKVVFTFTFLVPLFVPVPFLLLGLLVCVVQTLVWTLLSMVYISMATAHDH